MASSTMMAITIQGAAGPASALVPVEVPMPAPSQGQILIRNHAAGVNRPDIFQRQGHYPPPPGASPILGLEVAGEVAAVGSGVDRWKEGDKVAALIAGGGYAEYALADARHALAIPKNLDYVRASALPETAFTVYANLIELGGLKAGETVMIHGATSGIGVMAIQVAKAVGARVIGTGRGRDKAAQALALGADLSIDTTTQAFAAVATSHGGADVILDMVAGPYFRENLEALRPGGRLVHIAFQAGANVELPIPLIMQKRLVITGSTLRGRDADEKARLASAVEATIWPWVETGQIKCLVDSVFPLADAAKAHARLEAGAHVGKVILTMGE